MKQKTYLNQISLNITIRYTMNQSLFFKTTLLTRIKSIKYIKEHSKLKLSFKICQSNII